MKRRHPVERERTWMLRRIVFTQDWARGIGLIERAPGRAARVQGSPEM